MDQKKTLAYVCFAAVCLVWGTTYLAIRVAVETIPPLLLTGMRYTFAGLLMLAISRVRGEAIPRDRRVLKDLALVGILMVGVGNLAVVIAELWVPSGMAALLVATAPFWMALMESMRSDGERLDARGVIGMITGFAGVAMLVAPGGGAGHIDVRFIAGAVLIQLGSIGWQYGTIKTKYSLKQVPFFTSVALQMLFGAFVVDVIGLAIGEGAALRFTPRTFGALAYLAVFGSVVAYTAYVYATGHLRTTRMSLYAYVNPLVAVVLGWAILHERLTVMSIVAMCVILAGVAIVQGSTLRRRFMITREQRLPASVREAA